MRRRWRRNTNNYPKLHSSSPIGEAVGPSPSVIALSGNFCAIPIRRSVSGLKAITHPGIGNNVARGIWRGLQFFAELRNEHAQVFDLLGALTTPDRAQQSAMRHHFAGVAGEIHE